MPRLVFDRGILIICKGLSHEGSLFHMILGKEGAVHCVSSHAGDGLLVGASRRLALTGLEDGKITGRHVGRPPQVNPR
jgi:hypothetical protein